MHPRSDAILHLCSPTKRASTGWLSSCSYRSFWTLVASLPPLAPWRRTGRFACVARTPPSRRSRCCSYNSHRSATARDMAKTTKIDEIAFAGRSGTRYAFRIYVWETKFKAVPGVYIVASRTLEPGQEAHYAPLFVGETADLSAALKAHPRDECFQMYYGNVVGVLKEGDEARRAAIRTDLLGGLTPPCNAADAP